MNAERERKIDHIVTTLNERGKRIPRSITELTPFPSNSYAALQSAFREGALRLYKQSFHYDAELFPLLAKWGMKIKYNVGLLVTFAGPIAAIAAALLLSWWWLLAVPVAFFVGMGMTRSAYQQAIFLAALESEAAFCLLYFYGQIGLHDMQTSRGFYYDREKHTSVMN